MSTSTEPHNNHGTLTLQNYQNPEKSYLSADTKTVINLTDCYIQNNSVDNNQSIYINRPQNVNVGTCTVTITDTYFNKVNGAEPNMTNIRVNSTPYPTINYQDVDVTKAFLGTNYTFKNLISSSQFVLSATK